MTIPYNVVLDQPVGYTQNVTVNFVMPDQTIADMQGIGNGTWVRYQQKWAQVETSLGVYTWTNLDTAVSKCNQGGVRILIQMQSPPAFRQTLDGLGSDAKLNAALASGTPLTSMTVTALRAGAYIPAGVTLSINFGGGTAETVVITGGPYTQGATTVNFQSKTFTNTHNINEPIVENSGGFAFANASDWATFMGLAAARYNGGAQGRADGFQIDNENYDSANRLGSQGATANWDGTQTWDNGGAIFAPVYNAVRPAVLAQLTTPVPVVTTSVRRTANTAQISGMSPCIQHVQNWCQGFAQHVTVQVDWFDFHFYHGSDVNFDGSLVPDPTIDTFFDSAQTQVNSPSVQRQLTIMKNALAASNINPLFLCGEFGWDLYDDGTGTNFTLNQTITAGQGLGTIACLAISHGVPNAEGVWLDNNNTPELYYTFGAVALNATSITLTTDPRGNGGAGQAVAQKAPVAQLNHSSGVNCYAQATTDTLDQNTVATYFTKLINAMKSVGGKAFCFTFQANSVATTPPPYPASSNTIKGVTQTIGGVYTRLAPYNALANAAIGYTPPPPVGPSSYGTAANRTPGAVSGGFRHYPQTRMQKDTIPKRHGIHGAPHGKWGRYRS